MADTGHCLDGVCQFEVCGWIYHCLMNKDWDDFARFGKQVILLKGVHLVEFHFKLATERVQRIAQFFANALIRATQIVAQGNGIKKERILTSAQREQTH